MIKMELLDHQQKGLGKFWKILSILTIVLFLFSNFVIIGNEHDKEKLITILINDFCKSYKSEVKKSRFFFINSSYLEENQVEIFKMGYLSNKVVLSPDGTGYYPIDYIIFKDKIFFIDGEITSTPTIRVFNILKENKLIDSSLYKVEKGLIRFEDLKEGDGKELISERRKIATYVVCKKNNGIISKWLTNKANVDERKMKEAFKKSCNR